MRKLLSIFMCMILAALLTACGDKDESPASSSEVSGGIQQMDFPEDDDLGWGEFVIVE